MLVSLKLRVIAASVVALSVTACGGSGTPVASAPPPPPAGTPNPPPVQVSVPTFPPASELPTFYTTAHAGIGADVEIEQSPDGSLEVVALKKVTYISDASYGNFEYRGPDNYAVEFAGFGGPVFSPSDRIESRNGFDRFQTIYYDQLFSSLDLAQKNTGVELTYSSFGNEIEYWDPNYGASIIFFAVGSGTPQEGMPKTGAGEYDGIADGLWVDGSVTRRLYGSPATLKANFATGQLSSTLELRGHDDPFGDFLSTPITQLGTFTGTATISGGSFFHNGKYAANAGYEGTWVGRFFGPYAEEVGWSFVLNGAPGQVAFGAAVARRK